MTDTLLTRDEVADILRVAPRTVLLWLRQGKLKGVKLPGRNGGWRVRRSDLDEFIDSGLQTRAEAGHVNSEVRAAFGDLVNGDYPGDSRPVLGALWWCTDVMPGDLCASLDLDAGSTYAQGVRRYRQREAGPRP